MLSYNRIKIEVNKMAETFTLRLSDQEYEQISAYAENEHRPISNFITHVVLRGQQRRIEKELKDQDCFWIL